MADVYTASFEIPTEIYGLAPQEQCLNDVILFFFYMEKRKRTLELMVLENQQKK